MPSVDRNDLEAAFDWVSSDIFDNEAFVCLRTGRIYWVSEDSGAIDAIEDGEIPEDLTDCSKYLAVPNRRDLDLGVSLVFDFVQRRLPDDYDRVRGIFRKKGAYRRFKELLERQGLLQDWYSYSDERETKALEEWCETHGVTLHG